MKSAEWRQFMKKREADNSPFYPAIQARLLVDILAALEGLAARLDKTVTVRSEPFPIPAPDIAAMDEEIAREQAAEARS